MKQYISTSEKETKSIAKKFAKKFKRGVIALSGELGAGKTTFVQGFAKGLGIKEKIISPTFVLIRQHKIPNTKKALYHVDLYRLDNLKDLEHIGLKEILSNKQNLVLIEWAEKAKKMLPQNTIWIYFNLKNKSTREIRIHFPS